MTARQNISRKLLWVLVGIAAVFAILSGQPALYYPAIILAVFASLVFFAGVAAPPEISKDEFRRLGGKYSKKVFLIDGLSILLVLIVAAVVYSVLAFMKGSAYAGVSANAVFTSNPQGLLFIAAFLLALSSTGWLVQIAVNSFLGKDYWKYYCNRMGVGFDTEKIYRFVSAIALVLSIPALVFGFMDFTAVTNDGIHLNNWVRLSAVEYGWGEITQIEEIKWESRVFYVLKFSDGSEWNTSNEKWGADEKSVIGFIAEKSGKSILKEG